MRFFVILAGMLAASKVPEPHCFAVRPWWFTLGIP